MAQKVKILAMSLLAVFATGAVAASGAQAVEFHSEIATTVLHGEHLAAAPFVIDTVNGAIKCKKVTWTGTSTEKTTKELTLRADDNECSAFGQKATLTTGECDYKFTEPTLNPFDGKVKIECPTGQDIVIDVGDPAVCSITIEPNQEPPGVVDYQNQGAGAARDILVTFTLKEVKYVINGGGPCGNAGETRNDGKYTGAFTLEAFEDPMPSSQVGLWVE